MRRLLIAVGPAMLGAIRQVLGRSAPEAEDVMQDAAEGLLRALPSFRGGCTVLHFACRVAVYSALAWRRKVSFRAQWIADGEDLEEQVAVASPSPPERLARARQREALEMLLDEIPAPQAETLLLHCALDFTVDEIAAAVGRPNETIRSRLRLAKRALRDRIGSSPELIELLEVTPWGL